MVKTANPFDLYGQVALVVGAAAGGLGERAARALAAAGATVAVADLASRADDLAATARACKASGPGSSAPELGRPEAGRPEAGQPEGGRPEVGQPEGGQPVVGQPEGGRPEAGQPVVSQHEVSQHEVGQPGVGQPVLSAPGVSAHEVDVTDEASVAALIADVIGAHSRLDVVVNAAGVMLRKPYDETSLEEFERVVRVNLTGTWLVGREAGKALTRQGHGGRIVNLTTVYAERVGPVPESAYYASKAGVVNVTRALAAELGPHGVNVNCLAPGVFYPTQMTAALGADPDRLTWFGERTMLGRLGDPDTDLTGPLLLLASPAASYMTGQVVYVDGGWSAW